MKKTFKRAGVAVLSMAMLLSMGAVGLTANAVAATDTIKVNTTNRTGDTVASTTTNDVKVYQVAYRDTTGNWQWNFTTAPTFDSKPLYFTDAQVSSGQTGSKGTDYYVLDELTAAQLNTLATTLKSSVTNDQLLLSTTAGAETATNLVDNGTLKVNRVAYYLVDVTAKDAGVVMQPTLVQINGEDATADAVVITPKATTIPLNKTITGVESGKGALDTSATGHETAVALIGSTVDYKIATQLPTYEDGTTGGEKVKGKSINDFVITDSPADGITISDTSNVSVTIGATSIITSGEVENAGKLTIDTANDQGDAGNYEVELEKSGNGFKITIPGEIVYANQGAAVEVTFKATVSEKATTGNRGNINTSSITYGNNYSTGGGEGTGDDTATVYTGEIDLVKQGLGTDGNVAEDALDGAHFKLQKKVDGSYIDVRDLTDIRTDGGKFTFGYLAQGEYKLIETIAPSGYRTAGEEFEFTITERTTEHAGNNEFDQYTVEGTSGTNVFFTPVKKATGETNPTNVSQITVKDPLASSLPGTGGMGTVLFTVGGAAIVLAAGAMFVVYMRKRKNEEQ